MNLAEADKLVELVQLYKLTYQERNRLLNDRNRCPEVEIYYEVTDDGSQTPLQSLTVPEIARLMQEKLEALAKSLKGMGVDAC